MKFPRTLSVVCLAVAATLLVGLPPSHAAVTVVAVVDVADTYTGSSAPLSENGLSASLAVYGTPDTTSVLRFVLPAAPAGQVLTEASLRVRTTTITSAGSANAAQVRLASDGWAETGTFYANRPTLSGPVLGTLPGGTLRSESYDIALTASALAGVTGSTTLAIVGTGSDSLWLWSRQASASLRPVLNLTYSSVASPDVTAPTVPAGLGATVTDGSVGLAWQASTDDVGVVGYGVHRSESAGFVPDVSTRIATVTGLRYTDAARPAGTWYYRVTAADAAGNTSAGSATATAVVQAPPPPPPPPAPATQVAVVDVADTYTGSSAPLSENGLSASLAVYGTPDTTSVLRFVLPAAPAGQVLTEASLRVRTTTITSAGSANAAQVRLASDGWAETGTFYANRPTLSGPVLGTLPGGTLRSESYDIALTASALAGVTGSTTLAIVGTGSDSLWLWSRQASASLRPVLNLTYSSVASPDVTAPTVPAGLGATVTDGSVGLAWQASTDDVGVVGYGVHRSESAGFVPDVSTRIATVTGLRYTDAARPAGTWYYRVTAADAAGNTSAGSATATAVVTAGAAATVMAVGDLACASGTATSSVACRHGEVAGLITAAAPDRFIALGDLQYQEATLSQFLGAGAYNDTFGPLKPITLPALGNHEYYGGTTGYFDYFYGTGVAFGPYGSRPDGYYATSIGSWTVIVLNTECDAGGVTGGCGADSPQYVWLQNQLTAAPTQCTLVAGHRPRWSTGSNHGSYPALSPLWDLMATNGVDVYLGAHNHVSEIFKPIGVSGAGATPSQSPTGIRSFTAGGGGVNQQPLSANTDPLLSAMEARSRAAFGPLQLTLNADSYSWQFLPISGMTFTNDGTTGAFSGTDSCH